jgi:hypothetical protein
LKKKHAYNWCHDTKDEDMCLPEEKMCEMPKDMCEGMEEMEMMHMQHEHAGMQDHHMHMQHEHAGMQDHHMHMEHEHAGMHGHHMHMEHEHAGMHDHHMHMHMPMHKNMQLAHAYVPWQCYHKAFSPGEALCKGTLFPELFGVYRIPK